MILHNNVIDTTLSNEIKVLLLDTLDLYYVAPINSFSNFGVVNVPYMATIFAQHIKEVPEDALKVFSNAKFINVRLSWEIV
jgi:hypothetical protein